MATAQANWIETNQRELMAAVGEVRELLEQHAAGKEGRAAESKKPPFGPAAPKALETLCSTFGLSAFERAIVLMCAGVELDSRFAAACGAAQRDAARSYPTFSLALAALPEPHWSAVTPAGPLRRWRLIEVSGSTLAPVTTSTLRIDERVLHYLVGIQFRDERLVGLLQSVPPAEDVVLSHAAIAREIAKAWEQQRPAPIVQLSGGDDHTRRSIAASACASLGIQLVALAAETIPPNVSEFDGLIRLWDREAVLAPAALYVDGDAVNVADHSVVGMVLRFLERIGGVAILGVRDRWPALRRPALVMDVRKPTAKEQAAAWEDALGSEHRQVNGHLPQLVSQFNLNIGAIRASVRTALASGESEETLGPRLWDITRQQARPKLDDLAQRIDPKATWDDLVLPDGERSQLREITAHVAHRHTVYEQWAFAASSSRGLGISALFSGPSGTGKTMAAEVLANQLRLDLYRIDLSSVVSKYIGETERNLRRVFEAAEGGGVILFFDEADALFGKRSEVKDSHDRYANIEISYLLQRMETYSGLAVLATNMKGALDQAFLRRIRFVVNFPFPDAALRAEIWRRVFPKPVPLDHLDINRLSRLDVTGGSIRNMAMNAAFLAANAGQPVRMSHLASAARSEFAKLDRPMADTEVAKW